MPLNGVSRTKTMWMIKANTKVVDTCWARTCTTTPKGPKQSGIMACTPKALFTFWVSGIRAPRNKPMPALRMMMPMTVLTVPSSTNTKPRFCSKSPTRAMSPRKIEASVKISLIKKLIISLQKQICRFQINLLSNEILNNY